MNFSLVMAALGAYLSHSVSFRVGNYLVSASVGAGPVHMTFGQALAGAEMAFEGKTGSITIGSTTISVGPWSAPS